MSGAFRAAAAAALGLALALAGAAPAEAQVDMIATGVPGPVAVFGPDGGFLALVEDRGETTRAVAVFV